MRSRHSSFDRPHESLRVRIAVRRFWRNQDDADVVFLQDFPELRCIFRISVDDEVRVALEKAIVECGDIEPHLLHEESIRVGCRRRDMNATSPQLNNEEDVEGDQAHGSPDFGGEEVGTG